MENILPFLLAMAALGYKLYDNFKQEQEKARKRNVGMPNSPEADYQPIPSVPSIETPVREIKPKPVIVEEKFYPEHPYEPKYKSEYREPRPEKVFVEPVYKREKAEVLTVRENINPEKPVQEVRRTRAIHKPHQHSTAVYTEVVEEHPYANFDLHDAVIKEAILNRPQY
jgi:hypothetical protein